MAIYYKGNKVSPVRNTVIEKVVTYEAGSTEPTISYNFPTEGTEAFEDPDNLTSDGPEITEWSRPSGWPNLDNLPVLDEGVYLTYDNTSAADCKYACFYCDVQSSGQITIARGHIDGNNFIQETTENVNTATYKEIDYSGSNSNYVIFKITPTTATKHMTSMYFGRITTATTGTVVNRPQYDQYCLERKGWLPYLSSTAGSGDNLRYCTEWMQHDNVQWGNSVTNLAAAWYRGRSLKKIEFGNWTGENCNITSLDSTFSTCNNIEKIDLTSWKTENWHVISINNMFNSCYNMQICIVPFTTTNWGNGTGKTFTMADTWYNCFSLNSLDLSSWDMSNLNVTAIHECWFCCIHLKSLNVKNWDTTKWTITGTYGLYRVWGQCRTLVDIDLSNWNTTNWQPVRADQIFFYNHKRRHFNDIKNWNTTNWKIVQFADAFNGCHKIQELDLRNWNTTNWKVNSLSATFGQCYNLQHVRIGTWNTSGWNVTNINYTFYYDYNLEDIDIWNWDVHNWPVTNGLYQTFYQCYRLKAIDFSKWVTTNWDFGADGKCDLRYFAGYCYSVEKIDLSPFNINAVNSLTYYSQSAAGSRSYSPFYLCYNLKELILPQHYKGHIDLSETFKLSHDKILAVFNALETPIANTAKVWIISTKYKLTTADIAIATNKGYTVVQS